MGMEDKTTELINQLWQLLEPVILAEGMELVELEYRRESPGWVLRLFIDQPDGITVDDCAGISQVVGDLLDVADVIENPYHLEVSSPGLNRPLRKLEHFKMYQGSMIEVKTSAPLQNRRKFKGILMETGTEEIEVDCQGRIFKIPLELLERARLCYFDSFEKQRPR
jgi:ribosome maturation factor RimP